MTPSMNLLLIEDDPSMQAALQRALSRRGMVVALVYGLFATFACIIIARPLLDLIGFNPDLAEATTNCTHILAYGAIAHMGGLACQFYLEALRRPNIATAINMMAVAFNLVVGLILVPEHGARLGNFAITEVSENETWVTVAEWMQTWSPNIVIPPENAFGADNSVYAARILWK